MSEITANKTPTTPRIATLYPFFAASHPVSTTGVTHPIRMVKMIGGSGTPEVGTIVLFSTVRGRHLMVERDVLR
jgi:hypothetical protein